MINLGDPFLLGHPIWWSEVFLQKSILLGSPKVSKWAVMIVWRLRGKIIRTVLCCCVWQLCTMIMRTHEQFLYLLVGLHLGLPLFVCF